MQIAKILAELDQEISRLEQARSLLAGEAAPEARKVRKTRTPSTEAAPTRKKKRNLSPEGRRRIADAVRRRWELQKKAGSK